MRAAAAWNPSCLGPDLDKMWPLIPHGQSDTACLDNALELLVAGGYPLAHAVMMLIPEAWAGNKSMDAKRKAFYEYHAALMEPWDGPAAIAFTDGRQIGATLDRNGLRPARYIETADDLVILASESGVLAGAGGQDQAQVAPAARQDAADRPGGRPHHRGRGDQEEVLAAAEPYEDWLKTPPSSSWASCPTGPKIAAPRPTIPRCCSISSRPLATPRKTSSSSWSRWRPRAMIRWARWAPTRRSRCCRSKPKLLYNYFKQNFAQVTNPPIDPIREELVMSLVSMIGPRPNLLGRDAGDAQAAGSQPSRCLTNADLEKIRSISDRWWTAPFRTGPSIAPGRRPKAPAGCPMPCSASASKATDAVLADNNILILSDRAVSADRIPIPAALATAAVHHHLVRQGLRMQTGLVVETGEAREVHHFCVLAGYGAEAINPYLASSRPWSRSGCARA